MRFDWTISVGHVIITLTFIASVIGTYIRLREEQIIHRVQIGHISEWIEDHDKALAENLKLFREMVTESALTVQILQNLTSRLEKLEVRR